MVYERDNGWMAEVRMNEQLAQKLKEAAENHPEKTESTILREGLRRQLDTMEELEE